MGWLETRRIPVLFAVATLLPIAALCWLGIRTLDLDRDLERQRRRERLEVAAGRVALDIEQDLRRIEAGLVSGGVRLLPTGVVAPPDDPVLFQPEVPAVSVPLSVRMALAAQQEYRDPETAIAMYQRIANTASDPDRGEALVALGGLLRRARRFDEALRAYADLEKLGSLPVAEGQPAALVAKQGRAKAFLESGNQARLRDEAVALAHMLGQGGWLIDRTSFDLYQESMVEAWGGPPADAQAVRRSEAVAELWRVWRRGELGPRGRQLFGSGATAALAVWAPGSAVTTAAVFTPEQLLGRWRQIWETRGLHAGVSSTDGHTVFGDDAGEVELSLNDTRLPFVLLVSAGDAFPTGDDLIRRRVVIAGIAFACVLMIAASYGIYRITARELLLARQQSDFVAAVSHEFRTPLTSMRHLLDLLVSRGVTSEDRKAEYYGLLAGETDRLQRMVETLLSFGRIDAGAQVWKLESLNVEALVDDVADGFRREIGTRSLEIDIEAALPSIRGDREALERAIWNLLENAAKYSAGESAIRLFARHEGASVVVGVQDHGIGIPVSEQHRVFQKFVRGDDAKRAGIRGVGVGLALVKRIVDAHGGSVRVTSEVGSGSTFTLVLPVAG